MKTKFGIYTICLIFLYALAAQAAWAEEKKEAGQLGIYAGAGTDISLGLGYGIKGSYLIASGQGSAYEIGPEFFYAKGSETSSEGIHEYKETTEVTVFGVLANYLAGYRAFEDSTYFIVGLGFFSVNVSWEESSPTDTSLGTPLGSGSSQSADGSGFGTIVNFGIGHLFKSGLDIRLELPILVISNPAGNASAIAPAITIMAGLRF